MTKGTPFPFADDVTKDRASAGEALTLALIAGVILAALASALGAMIFVARMPEAAWTAFAVGTVFGTTATVAAHFIAIRRS